MHNKRHYSKFDRICLGVDQALKAMFGNATTSGRAYPAQAIKESDLSIDQQKHSAALMRVNHAGEVSAQALYHSQGLVSRDARVREKMEQAAIEEGDHLAWCAKRLTELGSHTSYFNPLWYTGSFVIGLTAGLVGDKWSLGFLAETENQVVKHLQQHLNLLPVQDEKSHAILQQMQQDEAHHRDDALQAGAVALPLFVKQLMRFTSKIMVKVAYKI